MTARIDDLWHAAVNGRGTLPERRQPGRLVERVAADAGDDRGRGRLGARRPRPAASSRSPATTSPTSRSTPPLSWNGDLQARNIDLTDGSLVGSSRPGRRAPGLRPSSTPTTTRREIYTFDSAAASKLKTFESANLAAEIAAGYFKSDATNPRGALSQYAAWTDEQKASATDDAMIAFLRGRSGFEDQAANADDDARVPRPRPCARRHRQHGAGVREEAAVPLHRQRLPGVRHRQHGPRGHRLCRRQRRHAARLRRRDRRRALGLHPERRHAADVTISRTPTTATIIASTSTGRSRSATPTTARTGARC